MTLTAFKRLIMKTLIDDDNCLIKLIDLRNETELEIISLEKIINSKKEEVTELNELIVFLRKSPEQEE